MLQIKSYGARQKEGDRMRASFHGETRQIPVYSVQWRKELVQLSKECGTASNRLLFASVSSVRKENRQ